MPKPNKKKSRSEELAAKLLRSLNPRGAKAVKKRTAKLTRTDKALRKRGN